MACCRICWPPLPEKITTTVDVVSQRESVRRKLKGKYRGRVADAQKHELIRTLCLVNGKSLRETARLAGVSKMTVIRVCNK